MKRSTLSFACKLPAQICRKSWQNLSSIYTYIVTLVNMFKSLTELYCVTNHKRVEKAVTQFRRVVTRFQSVLYFFISNLIFSLHQILYAFFLFYLSYDPPPSHSLQSPTETEDSPVPLSQLNCICSKIF